MAPMGYLLCFLSVTFLCLACTSSMAVDLCVPNIGVTCDFPCPRNASSAMDESYDQPPSLPDFLDVQCFGCICTPCTTPATTTEPTTMETSTTGTSSTPTILTSTTATTVTTPTTTPSTSIATQTTPTTQTATSVTTPTTTPSTSTATQTTPTTQTETTTWSTMTEQTTQISTGFSTTPSIGPPQELRCFIASLIIGSWLMVFYFTVCGFLCGIYLCNGKDVTHNNVHPQCDDESPRPDTLSKFSRMVVTILFIVCIILLIIAGVLLDKPRTYCVSLVMVCISFVPGNIVCVGIICHLAKENKNNKVMQSQESLKGTTQDAEKPLSITKNKDPNLGVKEERPCSPSPSGRIVWTPHGANAGDREDDPRNRKISAGSQAGDSAALVPGSKDTGKAQPKKKKKKKRGSQPSIELGELRRPSRGFNYEYIKE
ncbi:cell wall integrity and stress response component 4-like isoform X3 [Acanthaster planci]|uniref:Cell wall integrity and stress response component 4-like isoform X3 n=1 Tax=Acanthaster planci TaxID=133434 RepID=A0A8B7Y1Y7_ACAPL|nr:cell wall integrity and stress response component 4-like isoform X3 [Acanthaster planci]